MPTLRLNVPKIVKLPIYSWSCNVVFIQNMTTKIYNLMEAQIKYTPHKLYQMFVKSLPCLLWWFSIFKSNGIFVRQIPEFHLFRVTDIQIGLLAERNTSAVSRVIEKQRYQWHRLNDWSSTLSCCWEWMHLNWFIDQIWTKSASKKYHFCSIICSILYNVWAKEKEE